MGKKIALFILLMYLPLILYADTNKPKQKISTFKKMSMNILNSILQKNIPREFSFDDIDFSFLTGLKVDIINLRMSENKNFMSHPMKTYDNFYTSQKMGVKVKFLPLLIGKVHMHKINITNPHFYVIRDEKGNFSFEDLFQAQKGHVLDWLNVDDMKVTGGIFHYFDASASREPLKITFDEFEAIVSGFSLNRPFYVNISMRVPLSKKSNIFFNGKAGPIKDSKNFEEVPVDMDFKLEHAPITPYITCIPKGIPIPVSGNISINYHVIGNLWSGLKMEGNLSIDNIIISNEDGKIRSIPFHVGFSSGKNVIISSKDKILSMEDGHLKLNKTTLQVNGTINDYTGNPELDVTVESSDINLDDIKKIHPFQEGYLPDGINYSGSVAVKVHVKGNQQKINISGKMDLTNTLFEFPGLLAKKTPSPQLFDFTATVFPETKSFIAEGNIDFKKSQLSSPDIIEKAQTKFREYLKTGIEKISVLKFTKENPIVIDVLKGQVKYNKEIITLINIKLTNCHQSGLRGFSAVVNGTLDMIKESIDITGEIIFPALDTDILIKQITKDILYHLDEKNRIHILINITGSLTAPEITFNNGHEKTSIAH